MMKTEMMKEKEMKCICWWLFQERLHLNLTNQTNNAKHACVTPIHMPGGGGHKVTGLTALCLSVVF